MSRWEVEMDDGTTRIVEAGSESEAFRVASQATAPAGGPSAVDLMKRGAARAPGALMQMAAKGMDYIDSRPVMSEWGPGPPFKTAFGVDTQALVNAPWDEAAEETHRRVFGGEMAPPGQGFGGKFFESLGGGLATPAPTPGGGSPAGMLVEGAGLLAGTAAGTAAEEAGLPWWAQMGLSMGASVAPSVAANQVSRRVASTSARKLADEAVDSAMRRAGSNPDSPINFLLSADPNADTALRAASEFKTNIPQGMENRAIGRLNQVVSEFPDPMSRPTTSQALDELGGATIESNTMSLDRGDKTYSRNLAGQRIRAVDAIDAEADSLRFSGDLDDVVEGYNPAKAEINAEYRAAWDDVPMDSMPPVKTAKLKEDMLEISKKAGIVGKKNLPSEFADIAEYGDTIPFAELQALRSELLTVERAGELPGATSKALRQGAHAKAMRKRVDLMIDEVAKVDPTTGQPLVDGSDLKEELGEGVDALRKAQRLTRQKKDLLNPKSPLIKSLESPKEAKDTATALLRGGPDDARRALTLFKQRPASQEAIKKIVMDELIGPDVLTEGGAKSAMRRLRDKRKVAVALFGAKHVQSVEKLLRKAKTVRSGRAGTRAAALGTASNTLAADAVTKLESSMQSIGQRGAVATTVDIAKKQTIGRVKDAFERQYAAIYAAATIDPELALDLLKIPGPAAIPKWAERMEGHLARNGIRVAAQTGQRPPQ